MSVWYDEQALLTAFREDMRNSDYGRWRMTSNSKLAETKSAPAIIDFSVYRKHMRKDERVMIGRVVRRLRDFGKQWKEICWVWGYLHPGLLIRLVKSLEQGERLRRERMR